MDMSLARQHSQVGPQPMLWQEMEAYARLRKVEMTPDLIRIFRKLEGILLKHSASQLKKLINVRNHRNSSD